MSRRQKVEFGDFQTPVELAGEIIKFVSEEAGAPSVVIEPTCGTGSFIKAGAARWGDRCSYYGIDINEEHIEAARASLAGHAGCVFERGDFFGIDWGRFFENRCMGELAVIGNPPWVTNAVLGSLNSGNLPKKTNFQGLDGLAAKTGKANFDIAEWMIIELIEKLEPYSGYVAMLCKTATARKVLKHCWIKGVGVYDSSMHLIDAKKHFNVSVDACLLMTRVGKKMGSTDARVYGCLSNDRQVGHIGLVGNELTANVEKYDRFREFEGVDHYGWRSGIKHDAARVMELVREGEMFRNGFGETVEIEDTYVYPLLKSSHLSNRRLVPQRHLLVTQATIGEDTSVIETAAPRTWEYLLEHSHILDNRRSIIYRGRPRFCIFGVGDYSFAHWKVAVSGLYKEISFVKTGPYEDKPIMVDDTCYSIPLASEDEADLICRLLNSEVCRDLLSSLVFVDSKRPVNVDILRRIDLEKLGEHYGVGEIIRHYITQKEVAQGLLKLA